MFRKIMTRMDFSAFAYLLLGCASLAVFFPVIFSSFLYLDDPQHFFNNPLILYPGPDPLKAIFFTADSTNKTYIPITILSFYVESLFFHFDPLVSHTINLVLHYAVSILVMVLGCRLGLGRRAAFMAAIIFTVHPMHVESVAWVTERKDVLYGFFYLAGLVAYCDYLKDGKSRAYILALVCAALSVLSKPMALSFPAALFLIDLLKERKFSWGLILEKVPFVCAVVPVALITYLMNARALGTLAEPFSPLLVIWCAMFYIQSFFIPVTGVGVTYLTPFSPGILGDPYYLRSLFLFGLWMIAWVIFRRQKWFVFANLFYILSTFFLWRFDFKHVELLGERFLYIPSVGFCFLTGYFLDVLWKKRRSLFLMVFPVLLAFLMVVSFHKTHFWKNTWVYFSEILKTKGNHKPLLLNLRAGCLILEECFVTACSDLQREHPSFKGRLVAGGKDGCRPETRILAQILAMKDLRKSAKLDPNDPEIFLNIGIIYTKWDKYEKAIPFLKRAAAMSPEDALIHYNLSFCYFQTKEYSLAMKEVDQAIFLDPLMPNAYALRGRAFLFLGDKGKAVLDALRLLELRSLDPLAYDEALGIISAADEPAMVRIVHDQKMKLFSHRR